MMDSTAEVHLQLGDSEEALQLLLNSTQLAPNVNPSKWLTLAQLQEGEVALQSYRYGIDFLTASLNTADGSVDVSFHVSQLFHFRSNISFYAETSIDASNCKGVLLCC